MIKNKLFIQIAIILTFFYCTLFSYQITLASSITPDKLGELLNRERRARGITELNWNPYLAQAASAKAKYMILNNYFDHYAPDGTTPWSFIKATPYNYKLAGENLAMDFFTSEAINDAWMASPTHKDNMLNNNYQDYAISVENGTILGQKTTLVVEMFGKPNTNIHNISEKINNLINQLLKR